MAEADAPTMKCLMCLDVRAPSAEHVIPKALGGSFVIHRVCRDCNSRLGEIDKGLVEHYAAVERRIALQLAGNRGSVPDPVADALRRPIDTGIPNVKVRMSRENDGYHVHVERFAEVNLVEQPDGQTRIDINFIVDVADADKAAIYLKSALRKAGVRDEEKIAQICAVALPQLVERHGPATIGVPVAKNIGGHHLGFTKIAYEMAHHWLGDAWLDDPIAVDMRRAFAGDKTAGGKFMIGDGDSMPRPSVARSLDAAHDENNLGYDPARTNIMTLYPMGNQFFVCVWLLDAFCAMVLVSDNAAAYTPPAYTCVAMDVLIRQSQEFGTIMPVSPIDS